MAKVRSLLLGVEVRPAGRLSHCAHNKKHQIRNGELRFVVKNPGPAGGEKGYCVACGEAMLETADSDLQELWAALEGT